MSQTSNRLLLGIGLAGLILESVFNHPALAQEVAAMFEDAQQPHISYSVTLGEGGSLVWHDPEKGKDWSHEPESGWGKRMAAWFIGLLPIESQL